MVSGPNVEFFEFIFLNAWQCGLGQVNVMHELEPNCAVKVYGKQLPLSKTSTSHSINLI